MPEGAARQALSDRRDALAVDWLLEQEAPRENDLLWLRRWLAALAALTIFVWLVFAVANPREFWPWLIYVGALLLAVVSQLPARARRRHREEWMSQERAWRGLPAQSVPTRVGAQRRRDARARI
jgi:cell division protein FtsW (lipid II flippase)